MDEKIKDKNELLELCWSKWRRLTSWKFYKIKDKNGQIIDFIPNQFQLYYLRNKHNRNILLKARQIWFSTMIQLDYLDDALFTPNMTVGIIAQDKDTAKMIRKDKIEVALDNLPDRCKWYRSYDKSNEKEIVLNNKSSIYVSNSFRWWTVQRMHVSEYGKICAKRPDKAIEIQTWALESVSMTQQIAIESTAEWVEWDFFEKCDQYSKLMWKPLTPLDYKFFFFPRWLEPTYSYEWVVVVIPSDVEEYFKKLEDEFGIELSQWQKNWYYLKKKDLKDKMKREYPSVYEEAFELATEWAYLEREINLAYQQNRITRVPYDPNLLVYTCWDIWWAWWWDSMSVRFFQVYSNEVRWIDHWEWSWFSMLWVLSNIVQTKPYKYAKHIWPHDMRVHSQMTGKTRLEIVEEAWYEFHIVNSLPWAISERIDMMRNLFTNCYIDIKNCSSWIKNLKWYKRKRNQSIWWFIDQVDKNGCQHTADAFWYWCQYITEELLPNIEKNKWDSVISRNHSFVKDLISKKQ